MGIAKVTTNFQVTIPKDVRRLHSIKVGDTVLFSLEGNRVHFMSLEKEKILEELAGSWKGKILGSSTSYVKNIRSGWSKRQKRMGL